MDQKELQEQIALYYSKLPAKAQEIFSSMVWMETLKKISEKYVLNDEQIETLGTETTLVLLGIIHLEEYEQVLVNQMGLTPELAEKMFQEIENQILITIGPELVIAFEQNNKIETKEDGQEPENIQEKNADTQVLNNAGIQIMPRMEELESPTQMEQREEMLSKVENPKLIKPTPSILNSKLSSSVQIKPSTTEHSLGNISKPTQDVYPTNKDPYRVAPGE